MNISNPDMLTTNASKHPLLCFVRDCKHRSITCGPICAECLQYLSTGSIADPSQLSGLLLRLHDHAVLYSRGELPPWARPQRHDMGG